MSDAAPKKGRGRPKGAVNKKTAAKKTTVPAADGNVTPDDNAKKADRNPQVAKNPMTDDQEHALTDHHAEAYKKALEKKKKADADFKNTCKLAKSEGVSLKQIKEYIDYQTEEGQERLREDLARKQKVAIWAGMPVGTQINFLDEIDRTPIDEKTFEDGKRAGLRGEPAKPPQHTPTNLTNKWLEGHSAGQDILASRIKQKTEDQKADDAKEFRY